MPYPNKFQIECASQLQLARWLRRLPSPGTEAIGRSDFQQVLNDQAELLGLIQKRFRGWTPAMSKTVGWGSGDE